jgi:seryl-tRNA synthetase
MSLKLLQFPLTLTFILSCGLYANAQTDASTPNGRPNPIRQDLPNGIKETLAKSRIKRAEKEYQQLLERGEEAAKLGEEISKMLENGQRFTAADKKKLDRLEKLVKRIRTDLGGRDEDKDSENDKPLNFAGVIKNIQEDTANLLSEIKKIGRHTVSVVAIENSNSVLKLIRFLRFNSN